MKIYEVTDALFKKYGKVVEDIDFSGLTEALAKTPIPNGVVYEPSVEALEAEPVMEELSRVFYGEMPIQIGYCNGHNTLLNALEYHRDSEINIAATDAVLMLGLMEELGEAYTYDTAKVAAFRVPKGTAVELYATTLHYAPCHVQESGFQVAVVLPKGTNYPLKGKHVRVSDAGKITEDKLLAATNKWLIGHAEGGLDAEAYIGLVGENLNCQVQDADPAL